MTNQDEKRFTISQAAAASGINLHTLRSLFQPKRGAFRIVGGQAASGKGLPHLLSLRDVLAIAVAGELTRRNVPPRAAFDAGVEFAHFSSEHGGHFRDPGELYPGQWTMMIYRPDSGHAEFVSMDPRAKRPSIGFDDLIFNRRTGQRDAALIVMLDDTIRRVVLALQINGGEATPAVAPAAAAESKKSGMVEA